MVSAVVALAGSIGSGKTTTAGLLASSRRGSEVRSFGDVVRLEARRRGRGVSRDDLQTTGLELVNEGWDRFVDLLLSPLPEADLLVVDGVRHVDALRALGRRFPEARIALVYVLPPEEVVADRMRARGDAPSTLTHTVESELPLVRVGADLIVEGIETRRDVDAVLALIS